MRVPIGDDQDEGSRPPRRNLPISASKDGATPQPLGVRFDGKDARRVNKAFGTPAARLRTWALGDRANVPFSDGALGRGIEVNT